MRVLGATFRANPEYAVVQLDRLAPEERARVVEEDPEAYGLLVPRAGAPLEPRTVTPDTALLFFTMAAPGPLPRYVADRLGEAAGPAAARLVADGVLEILHDGGFVSGPRAVDRIGPPASDTDETSAAALRYAQLLRALPEDDLAVRLYTYGRRPVTPALCRALPDDEAVAEHLGVGPGGPVHRRLGPGWIADAAGGPGRVHWWSWSRVGPRPAPGGFKLYVSPEPAGLPAAVEAVAEALPGAAGIIGFKVGAGVAGMCRPDKLIAYAEHLDDLRALAQRLEGALAGCAAHPVPFTARITPDGLLSWGADPPMTENATSWRLWVARRLAAHLVAARDEPLERLEPWQVALERLRLSGVDPATWIPAGRMWPAALATA